ncbi:MAG TPA: thiamine pyrophosphate-dependent enzyme, partial [Pyrinomonadaceae bacterium]|nr:thiamine pyrophosphate-dependent enzyme [Pyrinomonadaceae bacterium]
MATGTKKIDAKTAGKNGRVIVAEKAKTTEADGYVADEKIQKTAKAETPRPEKMSAKASKDHHGLDAKTLVGMYRTMYTSRRIDDKEIQLKGQNKIFFQISGAGHEGILAAAAIAMKPGYDWFFPYYRDRALMLGLGMTAQEMLWSAVGAEVDPNSHGRQMPSHWGCTRLNVPSQSSCTGSQALHSVGAAEASYRAGLVKGLKDKIYGFKGDEIVYMSVGDGTTSEGEWWEALNSACNLKLPVIFLVEDNGYAISTPVEVGTAGGDISKLVAGFPGLFIQNVDGTDPMASYSVFKDAVAYCRARKGPAFIHAKVTRPYSHSLSDDEKLYRPAEELEADAAIDPIKRFAEFLMTEGVASSEDLEKLRNEVDAEVTAASDVAIETPQPAAETALRNIFSPDVDPTDRQLFDTEDGAELHGNAGTMVDLINRCMHEEMARDERIVVFGEDVADCSREQYLDQVKGKGGVFKVTANLQRKFGSARVFNSPLAEANIIGRAIGMSLRGLKPVVEIQF